jgi:Flp pilus assembly protein CpaB
VDTPTIPAFVETREVTPSAHPRASSGEVVSRPAWRAVTLPLDPVTGLVSLVQPGSHIDILTIPLGVRAGKRVVTMVAEDVRVLAMGDVRERTGRPIRATTLTVEVATDADAERLMKAAASGTLQFTLRGSESGAVGVLRAVPAPVELAPSTNR